MDPWRVTINVTDTGWTGYEIEEILQQKYFVYPELSTDKVHHDTSCHNMQYVQDMQSPIGAQILIYSCTCTAEKPAPACLEATVPVSGSCM